MASTSNMTLENGVPITVANLETIEFAELEDGNPAEVEKLVSAAKNLGFFNLHLQNSTVSSRTLDIIPQFYSQAQRYFDQPREIKEKDARFDNMPFQARGYTTSEVDENFEVSYDEIMEKNDLKLPDIIQEDMETLTSFVSTCQFICLTTLKSLSKGLGLQFENHHRAGEPSDSGINYVYEPAIERVADVKENLHTDYGTLTLGFMKDWGCHVKLRGTDEWGFAEPREGCVMVNVCDSLDRLSSGVLHSATHRVTQPCDGFLRRYFMFYFFRPERALRDSWA